MKFTYALQRNSGFSLLEVLTVVAILSVLMGALIVVGAGYGDSARAKATQGTLERIEIAMESYKSEFSCYPPDGYDYPVTSKNNYQLLGSACLTYFLAWKEPNGTDFILQKESYAENPDNPVLLTANNGTPYMEKLESKLIDNSTGEILDAWGVHILYDNVELDPNTKMPKYSPNPKGMNSGKCIDDDPRAKKGNVPFQSGSYDLWSHGKDGHSKQGSKIENDIIRGEKAK